MASSSARNPATDTTAPRRVRALRGSAKCASSTVGRQSTKASRTALITARSTGRGVHKSPVKVSGSPTKVPLREPSGEKREPTGEQREPSGEKKAVTSGWRRDAHFAGRSPLRPHFAKTRN